MLNKVTAGDIAHIRQLVPQGQVLAGDEISVDYHHDEMESVRGAPDVLVRAASAGEISAVVAYANGRRLPVIPRGSGTGLVGGAVATDGGIIIDTTLMNRIINIDTVNFTATVEAGVLLMELAQAALDAGLLYPPDPGEKSATIGGNISTNAGGMRAVRYGVTRDYVLSLTAVLADGSIETFGAAVVKNSSGLALKDLICGSEGTLAIITSATVKLVPRPAESVSLVVPFGSFDAAIAAVPSILGLGAAPTAVEFLTRECVQLADDYLGKRFPDTGGDCALLISYDGSTAADLAARVDATAELCLALGASDVFTADTDERKDTVWSTRGAFLEAIKAATTQLDECDVVVPPGRIAEFVAGIDEISRRLDVKMPYFGHAGDGNLHIYFLRGQMPQDRWQAVLKEGFDALYQRAIPLGGLVSGEHGIGFAKREYLAKSLGTGQIALMRRIKEAFDPNGILNPGKIF